jgi:hypothetical protein
MTQAEYGPRLASQPNASRAASFREQPISSTAFSGNFCEERNSRTPCASPFFGTRNANVRASKRFPRITGVSMVITTAHVPAIVALIAGILILIMPRLLNFIVAIYLIVIGLVGLGLLRWLHM